VRVLVVGRVGQGALAGIQAVGVRAGQRRSGRREL
jgi:hypothetical protein